jgi:hypothetical protein
MTPIRCVGDLAAAFSQPRAFLFLWVNWAIQAQQSKLLADEIIAKWHSEHPDESVPCYIADVSDQCGEVWDALAEWLTAENRPAGNLLMSGVGPLLWMQSGHVVLHVLSPINYGSTKLAAASHSVFT